MNRALESLKYTNFYNLVFPIIQAIQTFNWYANGKHSVTPHLIKQLTVKRFQKKYKIQTLVETGTYLGTMINASKNIFKNIYTIELDKLLYIRAKKKFAKFKHIHVLFGDSTIVLSRLLRQIHEPCLFWLDAHFSEGITTKGNLTTPIAKEIRSILNHRVRTHIILIDDASLFIGKNNYPTIKKLKTYTLKKYPQVSFKIENDIIQIISILNPTTI